MKKDHCCSQIDKWVFQHVGSQKHATHDGSTRHSHDRTFSLKSKAEWVFCDSVLVVWRISSRVHLECRHVSWSEWRKSATRAGARRAGAGRGRGGRGARGIDRAVHQARALHPGDLFVMSLNYVAIRSCDFSRVLEDDSRDFANQLIGFMWSCTCVWGQYQNCT